MLFMPFKIDRNGKIVSVRTMVFTGDVKSCLRRRGLAMSSVSTRAAILVAFRFQCLIVYVLTVAALNGQKRTF